MINENTNTMKTAIIINFQGENLIGKFSENNGQLKLEETLASWEHHEIGFKNKNYTNAAIMDRFNMLDCQNHDYQQLIIGVGSNYKIAFVQDNDTKDLVDEMNGENFSYEAEKNEKVATEEKAKEEKMNALFHEAKETNTPVEIFRYSYETDGDYVQVINEITYAMPDGTEKTLTEETH